MSSAEPTKNKILLCEIRPMDDVTYKSYAQPWLQKARTWYDHQKKYPLLTHGFLCKYEDAEDWTLIVIGALEVVERMKKAVNLHNNRVKSQGHTTSGEESEEEAELLEVAKLVISYLPAPTPDNQ